MATVGTRLLQLDLAAEEVTAEVSTIKITSAAAESDFITFEEAAQGGKRDYKLVLVAKQDHETGTIWDQVWSNAGSTIAGVYRPHGNEVPSTTQPHFGFNAIISEPEGDFLGAEADPSPSGVATIEVEWALTGKPTKITTAG